MRNFKLKQPKLRTRTNTLRYAKSVYGFGRLPIRPAEPTGTDKLPIGGEHGAELHLPTKIGTFDNVLDISSNWIHALIIDQDHNVHGYGYSVQGQLGELKDALEPTRIDVRAKVKSVAVGRSHNLLLTGMYCVVLIEDDGLVIGFGQSDLGQLGVEPVNDQDGNPQTSQETLINKPQRITFGASKIAKISCGFDHNLAITDDGYAYTWGLNNDGQLGLGMDDFIVHKPEIVNIDGKIIDGEAGFDYTLLVHENGKMYAFGSGEMWQLGDGERDIKMSPTEVSIEGEKIIKVATGGLSGYALTGDLYAWGVGESGRLGTGNNEDQPYPTKLSYFASRDIKIKDISAGGGHVLAITTDNELYAWGIGRNGRLGFDLSTSEDEAIYEPTRIPFFEGKTISAITTSPDYTFVITEEK